MSTQLQVSTVQFHGQSLITIKQDLTEFVAMRPVIEGIGLSWSTQSQKLQRQRDKFGCVHMNTPSNGGMQEMLCIPLKKLNGWLFTINPEKVRPEIRETVVRYQEECFQALHDYWHEGQAVNPRIEPPSHLVPTTGNLPAVQLLQLLQRQHDETGKLIELGLTAYATATEAKATADTALNEIRELKAERDQVREALDQLPLPIVEAPTETGRMKLLKVVANIAKLSGREFQLVWNAIYDDFRIRCHIDLKARSRHDIRKRKPLDIAEDEGLIERLYAIAHEHLTRIQRIQEVA